MINWGKILTQADCAEAQRQVMGDKELKSGEKSRYMQSLETLSKTIKEALLEEERRGNESKTAVKRVEIEFVTPTEKDLERLERFEKEIKEMGIGKDNGEE